MVYPSWEYTVQRCLCQVRMYAPAYSCCALIASTCNFFDFTTTICCCCCFCCWNFKLLESSIVFACHKLLHLTPANCNSKNCRFWKIQWQHEANHAYAAISLQPLFMAFWNAIIMFNLYKAVFVLAKQPNVDIRKKHFPIESTSAKRIHLIMWKSILIH